MTLEIRYDRLGLHVQLTIVAWHLLNIHNTVGDYTVDLCSPHMSACMKIANSAVCPGDTNALFYYWSGGHCLAASHNDFLSNK